LHKKFCEFTPRTLDIFAHNIFIFEPWVSMTNQGKLSAKLNPRYVRVLKDYLGWSIKTYVSKLSNIKNIVSSLYRKDVCKNIFFTMGLNKGKRNNLPNTRS